MNSAMVRAVLNGTKTQTRRIFKLPKDHEFGSEYDGQIVYQRSIGECAIDELGCPHGQGGDRLWVRENFQPLIADGIDENYWRDETDYKTGKGYKVSYPATDQVVEFYDMATDNAFCNRVTPSIHMPRWASRITLEIVSTRVERLKEISEMDAMAEGCDADPCDGPTYYDHFRTLWESINGEGSWNANPWVWVIEFKVMKL